MKIILVLLFALLPLDSFSADSLLGDGRSGIWQLNDNSNKKWNLSVVYTTDGNGNAIPIGGSAAPVFVTVAPNTAGATVNNSTITTTATSFAPPANAVGFQLSAEAANTQNIRWAIGATASPTVGQLAEPGRDSNYMPVAATISVASVSGTQGISIIWILSN